MPTARARMLELSDLASGASARAHFLSITQVGAGGGETVIVQAPDSYIATISALSVEAELSQVDVVADISATEISADIETTETQAELSNVNIKSRSC